ncbi:calcium-activated BK potassium channel alpha subunit-domain-containing protein [Fennellomyces sp. T-0311]|nr:calcium-activated BK potassium channel alpha subunit-domain-containing protein [Fennellomyces sp. T-0311]
MAAFQYCEATFVNINYSIIDSLYFVMVTLSTVGYGDITAQTEASRVVVMLIIVTSLAVLPGLISDVLATVRKRNDGGGQVSHGVLPFILIIGAFRPEQVSEILDGFLNRENAESHLNVVFLDVNKPAEDLKLMERNSMWGHRIQFLHGSVLNDKTLQRARARYAKAIFTISDQNAQNSAEEDERNTVRLWSLYCYTVSHEVPIYTYNLSPTTAIYQKVAKEIICVQEFKQYLLAMNCRCRGASTLLTNLLHQRQPMNHYDEPWQAQYDDGSCNEIYTAAPPDFMIGLPFAYVALIVFKECQVILFAIKTYAADRNDHEILLNPSNDYIIKETDLCVYISESPKEIKDIKYLNKGFVWSTIRRMRYEHEPQLPVRPPPKRKDAAVGSNSTSPPHDMIKPDEPAPAKTKREKPPTERYKLSRLPTPRHALLTGSRELITRLGMSPVADHDDDGRENQVGPPDHIEDTSLPLSYILEAPVQLDDAIIDSTEGMRGHILVCVHREVVNIFKFIYNLRSPHMKPEDLQNIVLLCPSRPTDKTFELINMFPKVYFMVGSCRQPDDLLRAGVKRAKQVVVMSEKECLDDCERNSDSPAIMTSHIIDLLVQERARNAYTIVNLSKSYHHFLFIL